MNLRNNFLSQSKYNSKPCKPSICQNGQLNLIYYWTPLHPTLPFVGFYHGSVGLRQNLMGRLSGFHTGYYSGRLNGGLKPCFVVAQSLSRVQLFITPWTAAHQASLSLIISQSLLNFLSIESMVPSNHLILSSSSPSAFSFSQHQGLFQWVSCLYQVAKYWSFIFSISPSKEYSGLISFKVDWSSRQYGTGTKTEI